MKDIRNLKMRVGNILILHKGNEENALYDLYSKMNEEKFKEIFNLPETEAIILNGLKYFQEIISGKTTFDELNMQGKFAKLIERNETRQYYKEYHADLINKVLKELGSNIEFKR